MYNDVSNRMARLLYAKHGAKAVAEAAQKAVSFERAGDEAQARLWRRVESALVKMREPKDPTGSG